MEKIPLEKVLKAKERLDMSSRGSDEEYYMHLLDVWCEFVKYKSARTADRVSQYGSFWRRTSLP